MVMTLKRLSQWKTSSTHDQSRCIKVDAKIMLTGFMGDAIVVHSADAAQGKTWSHHFYLAGVSCL
jgi:hypothetical protein